MNFQTFENLNIIRAVYCIRFDLRSADDRRPASNFLLIKPNVHTDSSFLVEKSSFEVFVLSTQTQDVPRGSTAYVFIFSVSLTKSNKVRDVKLKPGLMHLLQTAMTRKLRAAVPPVHIRADSI